MIKTTFAKLQLVAPSLRALGALKLPVKAGYSVSKILRKTAEELELFDKQRIDLVKEHGSEVKDRPGIFSVHPDQMEAFSTAMQPLLDTEVEIGAHPVRFEDLGDVELEPAHLAALIPDFVSEPAESKPE